mgnify:CR=1 FL=1
MSEIQIFFSDLKADVQSKILKAYDISGPEDMNWDVVPLTIIPVPQ